MDQFCFSCLHWQIQASFVALRALSVLLHKLFLLNKAQIQLNLQLNQHERALRQSCSHLLFTLVVEATGIISWWACVLDIAPSGPIHRGHDLLQSPAKNIAS